MGPVPASPSERSRVTPHEFISKWWASELKERSASQEHFIDLCRLLGEPTPVEADPTGATYCFERGARKDTGGDGWADVWKRHHRPLRHVTDHVEQTHGVGEASECSGVLFILPLPPPRLGRRPAAGELGREPDPPGVGR